MPLVATIWLVWLVCAGQTFAQNPYYDHGSFPSPGTLGSSAAMRAELDLIEAGFAKLPTLAGNANKVVVVNGAGTALTATDSPIQSGTAFPVSPSVNALFLILDDVAGGDCDSGGGTVASLCRWDGVSWQAVSSSSSTPGLSQVLAVDRIDGDAVSLATAVKIGSATASAYVVTYYDAVDGLIHTCEIAGVLNDCDRVLTLLNGRFFRLKNGGSVKFEVDHTGAITEGSIDCETTGVNCTLYQRLPGCGGDLVAVDAAGNAAHIWTKAVGATVPTATAEVGSNSTRGVATFPDVDGDYGYEFGCLLHAGWTGQLDAKLIVDSTGSGNFVAQLYTKCYANNAAKDAAWNTVSAHTFTLGTANQPNIYTATNVTATGCAGGSILRGKLIRNRTHASDTANAALKIERFEFWGRTTY